MSKKNLKLFIILIILIGVAYLYQGPFKNWEEKSGSPDNFLSSVNVEEINKIEITRSEGNSMLIKSDDKWKVEGDGDFYISENLAINLSQVLKDASESEFDLISSNVNKKSEFKTDISGIKVKFYQDSDLKADFIIGTLGSDFVSTYVSKVEINETYLVKANLFGAFSIQDWRDKTIFKSNKDNINKIRFQYPNREFSIEKKDDKWVSGEQELDVEKVDEVLTVMANLSAINIPEQNFDGTGLEKNLIIIEAAGDFINNTIMVGEVNDNGQYYAKKGDSDNIYLITEAQRDILDKKIQDLE